MIRPQSITTYPCSIIITLWQLLGVGSALAKLTCNPVDFFVVVLVVMEHFYHLFACHQIKKKLVPRSFKMGSPLYYIPLLQKEIFSHRHWTHYKTDDDSSMQYYFMKCILLQHFDFTQLWLQAMSRTCQKTPFILPTTRHLGPSLFFTKCFYNQIPFICHQLSPFSVKFIIQISTNISKYHPYHNSKLIMHTYHT